MGGVLAGRRCSVMTTGTGTSHPGMIEIHGGPVDGDVTVITHIAGR